MSRQSKYEHCYCMGMLIVNEPNAFMWCPLNFNMLQYSLFLHFIAHSSFQLNQSKVCRLICNVLILLLIECSHGQDAYGGRNTKNIHVSCEQWQQQHIHTTHTINSTDTLTLFTHIGANCYVFVAWACVFYFWKKCYMTSNTHACTVVWVTICYKCGIIQHNTTRSDTFIDCIYITITYRYYTLHSHTLHMHNMSHTTMSHIHGCLCVYAVLGTIFTWMTCV